MGQFRATRCPLCEEDNKPSKWTCKRCTRIVDIHRDLIRNLQHWHSLYEAREVPDSFTSGGTEYSLWDVWTFYEARVILPERQRTAIQYCLFENLVEKAAAVRMGIAPSNPVGIYATIGLTTLLQKSLAGELPRYAITLDQQEPVRV